MSSNVPIKVENLSKCYHIYKQPRDRLLQMIVRSRKQYFNKFWAVRDITFEVGEGETVGIVGRNGSGKSTLLQLICGTINPTYGKITTTGRIAALLELGSGFNPEFTGYENVYMNGAVLGLSTAEIDARYESIISFADIGQFVNQPVKTYSSGMVVRLAFSVAINVNPRILVIDEALAVGDAAFQRKCMRKLEELTNSGVTLFFVSHDTETVKRLCSSAIYLHQGVIRYKGSAKDACTEYERDLFGASTTRSLQNVEQVDDAFREKAIIDTELLTVSEKSYGDNKVVIEDITIATIDSREANVFPVGAKFAVSYNVKVIDEVTKPIFGMMITTKEGICAFGINTTGLDVSLRDYEPGDSVRVSFIVNNNLGPGVYYLTCGVHSIHSVNGLVYHQRRMDTLLLKSLGRDGEMAAGIADLSPEIHAQIASKSALKLA